MYVSSVIKLLKLLVMSEFGVKWSGSLEGLNAAEPQGQDNKEICLVSMGRRIYLPHWRCQFMDLGSGWGDRKDLPIRRVQSAVIKWWSEDFLCECVFTVWF